MTNLLIPLSVPCLKGNEWKYVKECLDTEWVSTAGTYVELFEKKVSEYTFSKYAVACINATSALQVSLKLAGVIPDDEVIVSTLTFIAPVNAIAYNGAKPVFMDADEYYNIDVEKTIEFLNKGTEYKNGFSFNKKTGRRITALILVHVWGNACQLDELAVLCEKINIVIVEDASESLGTFYIEGKFKGKHTGTIGKFGCLSFNGNKIITSGGGGMILTNNKLLAEKASYLTTQAKDDSLRYIHNEIGYNFRLTNIHAAIGVAQVEQLKEFLLKKKKIYRKYLNSIKDKPGLSIANTPPYSKNNHWMNILRIDPKTYRKDPEWLMQKLKNNGIETRPVWNLNHKQKPYKNSFIYKIEKAEWLLKTSLCLPSSTNIDNNHLEIITELL